MLNRLVRRVAPSVRRIVPSLVSPEMVESSAVRLCWEDNGGHLFDAHDLSDGTLRAIALIAALTQPCSKNPKVIVIDEPELGLHPSAISVLGGLIRSASAFSQIIIATQWAAFLDEFSPEEVIVTELADRETRFRRLASEDLNDWLEDYTLSQLYDKNVLGGRP